MDFNMKDVTSQFSQEDIDKNKVMGLLAYIGILVLVPFLAAKDSAFARFHTNQGIVILLFTVVWNVALNILTAIIPIFAILNIVSIAFLVLMILGIVYAATGKAVELPVVGKIKLLK